MCSHHKRLGRFRFFFNKDAVQGLPNNTGWEDDVRYRLLEKPTPLLNCFPIGLRQSPNVVNRPALLGASEVAPATASDLPLQLQSVASCGTWDLVYCFDAVNQVCKLYKCQVVNGVYTRTIIDTAAFGQWFTNYWFFDAKNNKFAAIGLELGTDYSLARLLTIDATTLVCTMGATGPTEEINLNYNQGCVVTTASHSYYVCAGNYAGGPGYTFNLDTGVKAENGITITHSLFVPYYDENTGNYWAGPIGWTAVPLRSGKVLLRFWGYLGDGTLAAAYSIHDPDTNTTTECAFTVPYPDVPSTLPIGITGDKWIDVNASGLLLLDSTGIIQSLLEEGVGSAPYSSSWCYDAGTNKVFVSQIDYSNSTRTQRFVSVLYADGAISVTAKSSSSMICQDSFQVNDVNKTAHYFVGVALVEDVTKLVDTETAVYLPTTCVNLIYGADLSPNTDFPLHGLALAMYFPSGKEEKKNHKTFSMLISKWIGGKDKNKFPPKNFEIDVNEDRHFKHESHKGTHFVVNSVNAIDALTSSCVISGPGTIVEVQQEERK